MSPHLRFASLAAPALRAQPDRRLVRLAGEGSAHAMEEIVRRYRSRLVAFAAAIVPAHRAEDIVQESLERALTELREGGGPDHLGAWLYTIVRNRALNAVRDERVHVELDEQYDGVTPPPEIAARREEVAALVAGIKALPEAQRQALVQRELEGRSHEQIAAALGASPGAVRGLIFRARAALRHSAGALVPLPVLRWLLAEAHAPAGAGEAAGGAVAAAGVAAGGGSGVAVKAGAVLAAAALATGAGVGLRGDPGGATGNPSPERSAPDGSEKLAAAGVPDKAASHSGSRGVGTGDDATTSEGDDQSVSGGASGTGSSGSGGGSSGPGGGSSSSGTGSSGSGSGSSGHGGGDDDDSGHGGDEVEIDDDDSGTDGGEEELEIEEDHSGPGDGEDDLEAQ